MLARGVGAMHRRVMAISKRGEGDRFNHFFAQNEIFIGHKCLDSAMLLHQKC